MLTEFGKILRIIRINSGDSSRAMAKKLNLSPSYLSAIENGKRNIPSDIEKLLCDAYPLSSTDVMKIRKTIVGSCITQTAAKTAAAGISFNHGRKLSCLGFISGVLLFFCSLFLSINFSFFSSFRKLYSGDYCNNCIKFYS